ncbi:MAG: Gfo/Idh/MocA family oxidoreductase [Microbacterium sp.]
MARAAGALRTGVVGIGWAGQQHIAAYDALPGVELVAIAGEEPATLASLGERHDVPHRVSTWQELLDVPGLDAVSIAVPTFLHAPIAIAALERGIHVLSEKPIARNAEEGRAMVDAARSAGRVLEVVFNHRLRGDVRALAEVVASGELGRPYYARASWLRRSGIPHLGSWFTSRERAGGGPLIDIGVHVLDYVLHTLGEPRVESVTASAYAELGPRGLGGQRRSEEEVSAYEVEDFASAFLRLEGGGTIVLESSWAVYRPESDLMDVRVYATDGGAELVIDGASLTPAGRLTVHRDTAGQIDDRVIDTGENLGHAGVVCAFVEHVRDPRTWPLHDGSLALSRAKVIDACYRSAATRREVVLG